MKRVKYIVTKTVMLLVSNLLLFQVRGNAGESTGIQENYRRPTLTAPMLKQAPVVDGKVERSEWLGAAQGLPLLERTSGSMTEERGVFLVAHDAQALYVAFRLERPPYARQPGAEDRIEFFVHPDSVGPDYTFILYPDGRKQQGLRTVTTDLGWTRPWDGAVRVTATGWEGEMRIPFASLERKSPPKADDQWGLLFLNNRKTPSAEHTLSSYLGNDWPNKGAFGRLRFGGADTPAVQILEIGALDSKSAGALIEAVGGEAGRELEVRARLLRQERTVKQTIATGQGTDIFVPVDVAMNFFQLVDSMPLEKAVENYKIEKEWRETVTLDPALSRRMPLSTPAAPGDYVMLLQVADRVSGEVLASGAAPFVQRPAFNATVTPYLLTAGGVYVAADYRKMDTIPAGATLEAQLVPDGADKPAAVAAEAADGTGRRTKLLLKASDLFGKKARILVSMKSAKGETLAQTEQTVDLPAKPTWADSKIGDVDNPLPPWKPIVWQGDTAQLPLREIRFAPSGLPGEILSRGKKLLTAPMELTLGGAAPQWTGKLLEQKPGRAVWVSRAETQAVRLALRTTLEYDGMLRFDLTLDPQGKPAELKELVLRIPYRADGVDRREITTLKEFKPIVNLGDQDTGLQWFAEWFKGWQIGELPPVEMKENGATVEWLTRFIGKEGKTIREPLTLTFGLMVLPVRELDLGTYNRDYRHTQPFMPAAWSAEEATCELRYPLAGHVTAEAGAVGARFSTFQTTRLLQLGEGAAALSLWMVNDRSTKYQNEVWLLRGSAVKASDREVTVPGGPDVKVLTRIKDYWIPSDAWLPVGLGWRTRGTQVDLELVLVEPFGKVRSAPVSITRDEWDAALKGGSVVFGGAGNTLAVDEVVAFNQAIPAQSLGQALDAPSAELAGLTLLDHLDRLRLSRGLFRSFPERSAAGACGVAGGKRSGLFVQATKGWRGQAVVLPAGERSSVEVLKAYRSHLALQKHEQFTQVSGYYSIEHMPSASLREYYRNFQEQGLDVMMYGGFSMNEKADAGLSGLAGELALSPTQQAGAGVSACFATPAVDYYANAWKNNIDYYGCVAGFYDNTVNCRNICASEEHGCGWRDDQGNLQGRNPIFGARELAKRFRWLWHVYAKEKTGREGLLILHAGAREFYAASGFFDATKYGEGWMMGAKFELALPETWWNDGGQWRLGVPGDILTKAEHPFSPNYLMMYALLYAQPLRLYGGFTSPEQWHINPATGKRGGSFNPYFSKPGLTGVAAPYALWWQLQDDFDTHSAQFHPFWSNGDKLKLNHDKLRCSFYLHPGKSALFALSNFDEKEVAAEVRLNLSKLGLAGKKLQAFDAYTDEVYPIENGVIKLPVTGWQYRLLRLEVAP